MCWDPLLGPRVWCPFCSKARLCVGCSHGLKKCPNCIEASISSPGDSPWETQFLLSQYQKVEAAQCESFIQIELRGKDKLEITCAAEEFDGIFEKVSKKLKGFLLKRFIFAKDFDHQLRYVDSKCQEFDYTAQNSFQDGDHCSQEEKYFQQMLATSGKVRNFQKFVLEEEKESNIFLDGALRITRTTLRGPFSFFGRFASNSDFDKLLSFLKSENLMVIQFNYVLHQILILLLYHRFWDL